MKHFNAIFTFLLFPILFLNAFRIQKSNKYSIKSLFFGILLLPALSFGWGGGGGSNEPSISITATKSVIEGNTSNTQVELNITASDCPDTKDIKIHWATADGNATTADNDYTEANDTVTFSVPSGWGSSCQDSDKVKTITVTVNGDTNYETDEDFHVNLSDGGTNSSQKFTIDNNSTITIENDDIDTSGNLYISIADSNLTEGDSGSTPMNFTVTLSAAAPAGGVSVTYATSDGSATAGSDYNETNGTLTIPEGDTNGTITVSIYGDTDVETPDENFTVTLSNPTNALLLDDTALGVIVNDDEMVVHTEADDLCYQEPIYEVDSPMMNMGMCMNMGIVEGGMYCKQTIPIFNKSEDNLTDVTIDLNTSGISGSFLSDCGENNVSGNCSDQNDIDMGPVGIFGRGVVYDPVPDYGPNDTNSIYTNAMIDMAIFSGQNLYGSYIKNGERYIVEIPPCSSCINTYTTGPFDAWDIFRDIDDRNISTKVVKRSFQVTIASINETNDDTETKSGIDIKYNLINMDSNETIGGDWNSYDASSDAEIQSEDYNINQAYKDIRVIFKVCTDYNATTNTRTLYPYDSCSDDCESDNEEGACFRYFNSSDEFAIRPDSFDVNISDNDTFIADQNYSFSFKAKDNDANPTTNYNELSSDENASFDISLNLTVPNTHCQYQEAQITPDVNFTDGLHEGNFSFNRVGEFNLTLAEAQECSNRFAGVDCDDADVDDEWSVEDDLSIQAKNIAIKLIPDHFDIGGMYYNHHRGADQNFTYLSNFANNGSGASKAMASEYNLTITAKKADDTIASNYAKECFAKDINLNINYELLDGLGNTVVLTPMLSEIQYYVKDLDSADEYNTTNNFSTDINKTLISSVFDEEINGTANIKLEINFDRTYNQPINPFLLKLNNATLNDEDNISSTQSIDQNATFLYGRAKPSKYFYDDVTSSPATTPISVEVYCDKWPVSAANCPGVDIVKGRTNDYRWYLSTSHDMSTYDDGNITLKVGSSTGSLNHTRVSIDNSNNGIDNTIVVSVTAPNTVDIDFATTNPTDTSDWVIYNKDSNTIPSPFYRVRFIGTGSWAGKGQTGHIVGGKINKKKSDRLEW
ncbi:internalin, putative [hydrothermal vent metagenome]|uniref:Internalin, putative n=1 Tax=hydrothermal vent metagenome TaxID=652676 RepID=A0A1W1CV83_9ZZZZ